MLKKPEPICENEEQLALEIMKQSDVNSDKKITYYEFVSFITTNKDVLIFMYQFNMVSKDDLRPNFGLADNSELPDCDSDLEHEVLQKGAAKFKRERISHSRFDVKFLIYITLLVYRSRGKSSSNSRELDYEKS